MPSIRVLLAYFFPRVMGSTQEPSAGFPTGEMPVGRTGSSTIQYTNSYSVDYTDEVNRDTSSFVQLVDIPEAVSKRSDVDIEERIKGQGSEGQNI